MKNKATIFLIFSVCLIAFNCNAQRYFMKVESPNQDGFSSNVSHFNEFELTSFNFRVVNRVRPKLGSGGIGFAEPNLAPFEITFNQSKNLAAFYLAVHNRDLFGKVTISVMKDFNGTVQDHLVFTFTNVKFTFVSNQAQKGATIIVSRASLLGETLKIEHYRTDINGNRVSPPLETGWDIKQNQNL